MKQRIAQCKLAGKLGGKAVAEKYGSEWREARGIQGGQACLTRYGREFYRAIRAKRKTWN